MVRIYNNCHIYLYSFFFFLFNLYGLKIGTTNPKAVYCFFYNLQINQICLYSFDIHIYLFFQNLPQILVKVNYFALKKFLIMEV